MRTTDSFDTCLEANLVHGVDVRADARADDVGGEAAAGIDLVVVAELHGGGTHGFGAARDGLDLEVLELEMVVEQLLDGQERRVDGAVAGAESVHLGAVALQDDVGVGRDDVAGRDDERFELVKFFLQPL